MSSGSITWCDVRRGFGYMGCRGENNVVQRFYFAIRDIVSSEVDLNKLEAGYAVEFDVLPPPKEGQLPVAVNVRVFKSGVSR